MGDPLVVATPEEGQASPTLGVSVPPNQMFLRQMLHVGRKIVDFHFDMWKAPIFF